LNKKHRAAELDDLSHRDGARLPFSQAVAVDAHTVRASEVFDAHRSSRVHTEVTA
jgi:hypothetical protein